MTSRERVHCAIERKVPDRVPMDFSANATALARLKECLGAPTHRQLLASLQVDIVDLRGIVDPVYAGPVPWERQLPQGIKENFWGMRTEIKQTLSGPEEMYCDFILQDAGSVAELDQHTWPSVDWFDFSDFAARLDEWDDYALMATGPSIWQHPTFLRGIDMLLMDLAAQTDMAEFLMDKFTDFYLAYFDTMLAEARGRIDVLRIADDVGMQDRLMISRELFDRFFAPRIGRLTDMAHSHGAKVMFHSCGAIVPLIDRIIELGVDVLDPVQVTARGMEPQFLKDNFGRKICLHGSIDTQHLLPHGAAIEVVETTKEMIKTLGADGGFILAPSHVFQTDVPTENIIALYETGHEYGRYM